MSTRFTLLEVPITADGVRPTHTETMRPWSSNATARGHRGSGTPRMHPFTAAPRVARRTERVKRSALGAIKLQQALRDDQALDLVGALSDDQHGRVAVQALHLELLREPVPAVHTQRLGDDLETGLRGEQLGHAALDVGPLPGVFLARRIIRQEARGLDLRRHVGELELDRLVLPDGHAERVSLLRVFDGQLERAVSPADAAPRD